MDTDHLSLYQRNHPQVCDRIWAARQNGIVLKTTVVTVEEQYAGRLAQIRKAQTPEALIAAYDRLKASFSLFSQLDILEYNRSADDHFRQFRSQRVRIGTQNLRIASIAIAHGGTVLTCNRKDFEQVPGWTIEDWSFIGIVRPEWGPYHRTIPIDRYVRVYRVMDELVEIIRVMSGYQDLDEFFIDG